MFTTLIRLCFTLAALASLTGCATHGPYEGLAIDRSFNSTSQGPRVKFLILHYTAGGFPGSLKILTDGPVSSHYLVTDGNGQGVSEQHANKEPKIYMLVDESQRADHAGLSTWAGHSRVNGTSIGIEIVNRGYAQNDKGERTYTEYPKAQMDLVLELCKRIVKKYGIEPQFVLGHSDIAPGRKPDPGPLFPWKRFAEAGLIVWPDEKEVAKVLEYYERNVPDVRWFQGKLFEHGFTSVPRDAFPNSMVADEQTRATLSAFQAKYRQSNIDGAMDAQTAALLDVITRKREPKPAATDTSTTQKTE